MRPALPLSSRYRVRADVLVRELGGEAVLLDLASGRYFGLNATGRRIFELLDGARPLAAVLEALEGEFEATREELEADLGALVAELESQGLISLSA